MAMTTSASRVKHLNPDGMMKNPAFSQAIEVTGPVKTVYVGGQNAVDRTGAVVGKDDLGKQTEQVMLNISAALRAAGARLEDIVKMTVYLVQGQPLESGFEAYRRAWGDRGAPPTVTVVYVAALGRPEYLVEIDAVAVVPLA